VTTDTRQTWTNKPAPDITNNSVMLVLRLSRPGNRRKVESTMVEVDAEKSAINVSKKLLESNELKAIVTFDSQVRHWIGGRSLPAFGTLRDGVYRLPVDLVEEVNTKLIAFLEEREVLINAFLDCYDQQAIDAAESLRVLYDENDYAHQGEMRRQFGFEYKYLIFGVPESLSSQLIKQERDKAKAEISSEVEEIRTALRVGFANLVEHAADRLAVSKEGKKAVFRDSLVDNLEEFFQYFGARNIVGDTELAALVERARRAMKDVTADELRSDEFVRSRVQNALNRVREEMDANLIPAGARKIRFKEEGRGTDEQGESK